MISNQPTFICAQPALQYFYWQIRAMLYSFKVNSVSMDGVHVLLGTYGDIPEVFKSLEQEYPEVLFAYYPDERTNKGYHPSIKPYLMYKHYETNPDMENKVVFYHDCDIALTKPLDIESMLRDDVCYLSNTVSYIGYNYILSKGQHTVDKMCEIMNISEDIVRDNQDHSGGAQYLLKNVSADYWSTVYHDSEKLYYEMSDYIKKNSQKFSDNNNYSLQIWCAEMWATLWNLWKLGVTTRVHTSLDFTWATCPATYWDKNTIYHNAGVINADSGMFYKGGYINTLPYNTKLSLDPNRASMKYYTLIQESNVV